MTRTILIHVKPGAKQNKIQATDIHKYSIWVTTQPEGNKANFACLKLLAKKLNIAPSRLEIIRGFTGRHKTVRMVGQYSSQ